MHDLRPSSADAIRELPPLRQAQDLRQARAARERIIWKPEVQEPAAVDIWDRPCLGSLASTRLRTRPPSRRLRCPWRPGRTGRARPSRPAERNSTHRGVGLGLLIARHLARLMHGDIAFQSRLGEGSHFEVTLPTDLGAAASSVFCAVAPGERLLALPAAGADDKAMASPASHQSHARHLPSGEIGVARGS